MGGHAPVGPAQEDLEQLPRGLAPPGLFGQYLTAHGDPEPAKDENLYSGGLYRTNGSGPCSIQLLIVLAPSLP